MALFDPVVFSTGIATDLMHNSEMETIDTCLKQHSG